MSISTTGAIRGTALFLLALIANACSASEPENSAVSSAPESNVVGFSTGEEMPGSVPFEKAHSEAPRIVSVSVDPPAVGRSDPLLVTMAFEDEAGDIVAVNFGIAGEETHYRASASVAEGVTAGALLLELYPRNHIPGHYILDLSLTDEEGRTSPRAWLPFELLASEGHGPAGPDTDTDSDTERRDTGSAELDTADTDSGSDAEGDSSDTSTTDSNAPGPTFLMGFSGDATTGAPAAIVMVTPVDGVPVIETLSEVGPRFLNGNAHDYENQRLAFVASPEFQPEDRGGIAVIDIDRPGDIQWVPIPESSDPDYIYTVEETRPQVLSDGRIVYQVSYISEDALDSFEETQLAVWNPSTDELQLQGGLSALLLDQPEVAACNPDCDIELAQADGQFAVSPDDRYAYLHIVGMGVDGGTTHFGQSYLARWDIDSGETEFLMYLGENAAVLAVTGDNSYAVLVHERQWKSYRIATGDLTAFDNSPTYLEVGQVSDVGPVIMKGWRECGGDYGGVTVYDLEAGESFRVVDPALYDDFHKGISEKVQMNADASEIYFTASADECVDYWSEFVVMKSPVQENYPEPEALMTLDARYDYGLFVLLD